MKFFLTIKKWYGMIPYNQDWRRDMVADWPLYLALFLFSLLFGLVAIAVALS